MNDRDYEVKRLYNSELHRGQSKVNTHHRVVTPFGEADHRFSLAIDKEAFLRLPKDRNKHSIGALLFNLGLRRGQILKRLNSAVVSTPHNAYFTIIAPKGVTITYENELKSLLLGYMRGAAIEVVREYNIRMAATDNVADVQIIVDFVPVTD